MGEFREEAMGSGAVVRLVIAGDVRLYRDGIAQILSGVPGIEVTATSADVDLTLMALREHRPDVLLVDMAMPESLSLVRSLGDEDTVVVGLALPEVEATFLTCAEAGMAGYVSRDASVDELVDAVRSASRGELKLDPRLAGCLVRRVSALSSRVGAPETEYQLTPREMEIAALLAEGKTNKRIAADLHISLATVKNHVHKILKKTGYSRRSEVVARWSRHRMSELPELRARGELRHARPNYSKEDRLGRRSAPSRSGQE